MTSHEPVPDHVFAAARRLYIGATADSADAELVREWAARRWDRPPAKPVAAAFWVLSISFQDGRT